MISDQAPGTLAESCDCDYSAVASRTDCASQGEICRNGTCVDPAGPCADIVCDAPPARCDGDVAFTYSGAGTCDPDGARCDYADVEHAVDCAAAGHVCLNGTCVDPAGPCADVVCERPDDRCEGEVAVTYGGPGRCDADEGTCVYAEVETRTDCTRSDQSCVGGVCLDDIGECADVTCDAPPPVCDGSTAVRYSGPGRCVPATGECDYSGVTTRADCFALGQACEDGRCVDVCADIDCRPPASHCDEEIAVQYSGPGVCDPVEAACDFSRVESRQSCPGRGQICRDGRCVSACEGNCTPPPSECDGDRVVSYTGNGECDSDLGTCRYNAVTSVEDCVPIQRVCRNARCVDLCADAACPAPAPRCEGNLIITYRVDGRCVPTTGDCDFSAGRAVSDCAASDQVCERGECVLAGGESAVQPRDLVITEIMNDPAAVDDADGEWFEIYNATDRTLDLNGLTVSQISGRQAFTITNDGPTRLAPRAYFVMGRNPDPGTNGGVAVDFDYGAFFLSNETDSILLVNHEGLEVDRLEYRHEDFPMIAGTSMQLNGGVSPTQLDNSVGANWCASYTRWAPASLTGDSGSPGQPNQSCPPPITDLPIETVRRRDHPSHPARGARVRLSNVVVTAIAEAGYLWVQAREVGPYRAIYVDGAANAVPHLNVGDVVNITGVYSTWHGLDAITLETSERVGGPINVEPRVVAVETLADPDTAEPWESALVRLDALVVTHDNPDAPADHNEFVVNGVLRVDDLLHLIVPDPVVGTTFDRLIGVLNFSYGQHKLEPRSAVDVIGRR